MDGFVFKVKDDGFKDVGAELVPGLGAGEDRVAEGASEEAPFVGVADFEDYFHLLKNTVVRDTLTTCFYVALGCC